MHFPYDFGLIENTHAPDGDPTDCNGFHRMYHLPVSSVDMQVNRRLQENESKNGISGCNDRYFVVSEDSVMFEHIKEIKDFARLHNRQLRDFFYKLH